MGWPKGRPRPSKFQSTDLSAQAPPVPHATVSAQAHESDEGLPAGWGKGALLNVRPTAAGYCVTLWPEEYDPERPERAKWFANPAACQDFVSDWYSRQSADPRAR